VELAITQHFALKAKRRVTMERLFKRLWQEEEGQDLVEYGLLLVLVSLGAVAAMGTFASAISNAFGNASSNLSSS
jgi:pilus assembly protein Flp/PilA